MASLPTKGIDISEFNGDVDIAALKKQVDFVIIRCGYGGNTLYQDDAQYENNVRKCQEAGMPYGVYLYSYAQNEQMALSEAAHTLRLLKGKKPLYGVWYDVEDSTLPKRETLTDNCVTYCRTLEDAGYYCGIYSFLNFWEDWLTSPRLDRFDKWVAQWAPTLEYPGPVGIWQYTSNGTLLGQRFDMDLAYRDYPALIGGAGGETVTRAETEQIARTQAQQVLAAYMEQYRTFSQVPEWARDAVERIYRELELEGAGQEGDRTLLLASPDYVRMLYVLDKALEKMKQERGE